MEKIHWDDSEMEHFTLEETFNVCFLWSGAEGEPNCGIQNYEGHRVGT